MLWCFSQWHFIQFQLYKFRIRFKRLKLAFCVAIRFLFKIRCISLMASTVPCLDTRLSYWINGICGVCSKRSMEWLSLCVMWIHVFSYQNSMSHWSVYGYMIRDGRPGERGLYCKYPSAQLGISEANALSPPSGVQPETWLYLCTAGEMDVAPGWPVHAGVLKNAYKQRIVLLVWNIIGSFLCRPAWVCDLA